MEREVDDACGRKAAAKAREVSESDAIRMLWSSTYALSGVCWLSGGRQAGKSGM